MNHKPFLFLLAIPVFTAGLQVGISRSRIERPTTAICSEQTRNGIPVTGETKFKPPPVVKKVRPAPVLMIPPDMETLRIGDTVYFESGDAEGVLAVSLYSDCWTVETATTADCYGRGGASASGNRIMGVTR